MQVRIVLLLILVLTLVTPVLFAQSSAKENADKREQQPNSVNPSPTEKEYAPKKRKHVSAAKTTYTYEQEFYERMDELKKTKRKNERMMDDPQYSDPMYFGHKHPPKKHKPGKMKFCKVCGIRH